MRSLKNFGLALCLVLTAAAAVAATAIPAVHGTGLTTVAAKPNLDQYGACVFRCLRSPGGTPDRCAEGCAYLLQ